MSKHASPKAASLYRQLRLTATQETNGRLSYSLYAKPLNVAWHEHQCLVRGSVDGSDLPLRSMEDVLQVVVRLIEEAFMLPDPPEM
jgi:hypothetical protein